MEGARLKEKTVEICLGSFSKLRSNWSRGVTVYSDSESSGCDSIRAGPSSLGVEAEADMRGRLKPKRRGLEARCSQASNANPQYERGLRGGSLKPATRGLRLFLSEHSCAETALCESCLSGCEVFFLKIFALRWNFAKHFSIFGKKNTHPSYFVFV